MQVVSRCLIFGLVLSEPIAAASYCLTRNLPVTPAPPQATSEVLVTEVPDVSYWKADGVMIHKPSNNSTACDDRSEPCYVGYFDIYSLKPNGADVDLTYRPIGFGTSEFTVKLTPSTNKRYLHGTRILGGGVNVEIFVIFNQQRYACKVGPFDYGNRPCNTFDIEMYLSTDKLWEPYRPDRQDETKWLDFDPTKNCLAYSNEPGGGGGHDPPVHP